MASGEIKPERRPGSRKSLLGELNIQTGKKLIASVAQD